MTYLITKTNGEELTEILDSSIDTSATDLTLIGKNVIGYGEYLNENFVKLLENFASTSEPNNPIIGQLWYDLSEGRVKVYDGNGFAVASGPIVSQKPPLTPNQGDFWIDNKENQLYFYDGVDRQLAGPIYKDSQGLSGFEIVNINDTLGNNKTVTLLWSNANLLGIWSHHSEFTPVGLTNFSATIKPGFTPNPALQDFKIHATATKAESLIDSLGNVRSADDLFFNDESNTATGTLTILNPEPLILGANQETSVLSDIENFQIRSNIDNQDLVFTTRKNGSFSNAITVKGSTNRIGIFNSNPTSALDVNGNVTISGDLTVTGNTVTINSTELSIDDKTITLSATASPSDVIANGGGVVLAGTTNHTLLWNSSNDSWNSSENFNLLAGRSYKINNVDVITETTISPSVTSAQGLTEIGTLTRLQVDNIDVNGSTIDAGSTILTLSGLTISANNRRVTNVLNPTLTSDAATKFYVDDSVERPWTEKSIPYTAKTRDRILVSTLSGQVIIGLPELSQPGDYIRFVDSDGSFDINSLIISRYRRHQIVTPNGVSTSAGTFNGFLGAGIPAVGGSGTGLTVHVIVESSGTYTPINTSIKIISQGIGYQTGDIITIPGTSLGGTSPVNDLLFEITPLDNLLGADQDLEIKRKNASFGLIYTSPNQGWTYLETLEMPPTINAAFIGNLTGDVVGNVVGNLQGNLQGNVTGNVTGQLFGNVTGTSIISPVSLTLESTLSNIKLRSGSNGIRLSSFDNTNAQEQYNISITPGATPSSRSSTLLFGDVAIENVTSSNTNGASFRLPHYTIVQRNARILTNENYGELIYNLDENKVQAYTSAGWVNLH